MPEMFSHREIIYTIYKEQSFSRAAQKLFIAQPSLSLLVKKLEKQLAQFGVFFVQNHAPRQESLSVQLGVNFLSDKCDRYFLMHADLPLIDPDTLQKLKDVDAELVIPVHQGKRGQPLLLQSSCPVIGDLECISRQSAVMVDVEDPGILP